MKKNFPLRILLLIFIASCTLISCSERSQDSGTTLPDSPSGFSLTEIMRSFEADYTKVPQTRADDAFDESEVLAPGWITPLWDAVSVCCVDSLFQANVPFEARYGYLLMRWDQTGDPSFAPMPSRLVVLKDSETGETASYLRFLIPEADVVPDDGAGFSGLVLYTLLSGCPVSVGKFCDGVLSGSASLWDDSRTRDETVDAMVGLLQGIYVARVRPKAATRGVNDNNLIPAVEIVARAPLNVYKDLISQGPDIPPIGPPEGDLNFGGGGGGGGGGNGGNTNPIDSPKASYPANPKITTDKPVRVILDSLFNDCMGQLLINAMSKEVSITSGYIGGSTVTPVIYDLPTGPMIAGYEVKIGSRVDPIPVMEELMHIYQGQGTSDYRNAAMNNEVEAKLAWYMYCVRTERQYLIRGALGGDMGIKYFSTMSEYFMKNDLENPAYIDAYENAVEGLRKNGAYKNEDKYPFDPGKMNLENLWELMKDCFKK